MADLAAEVAMNRANAEIEAEEDDTGEPEQGRATTGAAVLSRAWSIGKGVAIAGAAITAAPIVIPPLVLLSALGLALSLPSGIYLAGYACTVKLMGALLPLPAEVAAQPEHAAERGFDAVGEDEKASDEGKLEKGEMSKGPANRSEEEEEEEKLKEKVGEKEEMGETVAADENRNRHYSLQEAMRGAEQVEEEELEDNESLKSPYAVVLMAPKEERENEPQSLSQEHLSIAEVECASSAVDVCPNKEEEDEKLDRSWEKTVAADEDRNRHYSQHEVIRGAEQVGEDLEEASASASENDEERERVAEPTPNSSYTVVLMVPKRERETSKNEPPNLSKEHLPIAEVRREKKKKPNSQEAVEVRGEDFECASSAADVRPKKDEDEELDTRKKKSSSRWACWKSHN